MQECCSMYSGYTSRDSVYSIAVRVHVPGTCYICTDSRPRARWYQLRGLPLVGSECVCPHCNSSSLSHGELPSHRRSAFPSISQELTRNANRKSGTPVTVNSPTVKCSTLQMPISGYQPQVDSDRVALTTPSRPYVEQ